jgi:hypothetical protein
MQTTMAYRNSLSTGFPCVKNEVFVRGPHVCLVSCLKDMRPARSLRTWTNFNFGWEHAALQIFTLLSVKPTMREEMGTRHVLLEVELLICCSKFPISSIFSKKQISLELRSIDHLYWSFASLAALL